MKKELRMSNCLYSLRVHVTSSKKSHADLLSFNTFSEVKRNCLCFFFVCEIAVYLFMHVLRNGTTYPDSAQRCAFMASHIYLVNNLHCVTLYI